MTGPPAAGAPVPGGTHAALPAPRPAPRATGPHDTRQHHGPQRPARPASATVTKHRPGLGWRWGAAEQDVSARVGPSPKAGRVWHQVRVSVRPSPAGTHGGGRWLQQPSAPPPAPSRQAASAPGPRPHAPRGGLCPGLRAQGARMPAAGTHSSAKPAPDGPARTRPAFFGCEVAGGSQIQPRRPQASTGFVRRRTRPPWRVGAQSAARDPQAPTRSCPRIRHASRHHSDPRDRSLLWLAASRVSDPTSFCRDPGPGPCGRVHVPTAGSLGRLPEGGLRPPVGCEAPPRSLPSLPSGRRLSPSRGSAWPRPPEFSGAVTVSPVAVPAWLWPHAGGAVLGTACRGRGVPAAEQPSPGPVTPVPLLVCAAWA